jgi:hypothetical protein
LSAALQLPMPWTGPVAIHAGSPALPPSLLATAVHHIRKQLPRAAASPATAPETALPAEPLISFAFYRKHTENLLRRYLYASIQVGRSPNLLGESVGRGWVSSRRVRTFEDALIFVLDVERCLKRLSQFDRQMISRIVLQEYTQAEAAVLLGISVRTVCTKLPQAIDRLTESLVEADLLVLPD